MWSFKRKTTTSAEFAHLLEQFTILSVEAYRQSREVEELQSDICSLNGMLEAAAREVQGLEQNIRGYELDMAGSTREIDLLRSKLYMAQHPEDKGIILMPKDPSFG